MAWLLSAMKELWLNLLVRIIIIYLYVKKKQPFSLLKINTATFKEKLCDV